MKVLTKLVCASILMLGASAVVAGPAAVIDDFGCSSPVWSADGELLHELNTTESHKVITASGVRVLTCHFEHDYDLERAAGSQGFPCQISGTPTSDSIIIATPSGKATLVCKINGDS